MPRAQGSKNKNKTRERIDVRLPAEQVKWLKQNGMTPTLEKLIGDAMKTKLEQAKERIETMGFSQTDTDFIFADWDNWEEHLDWLLTATRAEILSWIQAAQ